jgi:hypothetical protein
MSLYTPKYHKYQSVSSFVCGHLAYLLPGCHCLCLCTQEADDSAVPAAIRKRQQKQQKLLRPQLILASHKDGIKPLHVPTKHKVCPYLMLRESCWLPIACPGPFQTHVTAAETAAANVSVAEWQFNFGNDLSIHHTYKNTLTFSVLRTLLCTTAVMVRRPRVQPSPCQAAWSAVQQQWRLQRQQQQQRRRQQQPRAGGSP